LGLEEKIQSSKKKLKDQDFKDSQPYLFGEDLGQKAKEKLESAAALQKIVYQQTSMWKVVFQRGYPHEHCRGHGGGQQNNSALKNTKRRTEAKQHLQTRND